MLQVLPLNIVATKCIMAFYIISTSSRQVQNFLSMWVPVENLYATIWWSPQCKYPYSNYMYMLILRSLWGNWSIKFNENSQITCNYIA